MAAGTEFVIDVDVAAPNAEAAAVALARVATQLTAAGEASKAAADAVKAGEAAYKQAEAAADRAAKAVEKIGLMAEAQRGKMKAALEVGDSGAYTRAAAAAAKLQQRQVEATTAANAAKVALQGEAAALDRLRGAAGGAEAAEAKLKKTHEATKKAADGARRAAEAAEGSGKVNEMAEAFGKLGGPLGSLGAKAFGLADGMKKLTGSMGSGGIYAAIAIAIVAIVTAVIALTAAVVIGALKITQWAVGLADAARTQGLLAAGIAGSVAGGAELAAKIDSLTKKVPQSAEELRGLASELAKTGLKGAALGEALEDAAIKAAEAKFGPEWSKQMLAIDKQTATFGSHIAKLFGGLKIDGLLEAFSKLVALFDETSVTGRAIKVVFESLFQPIVDGLAALAPKIVSAFIQFEIWVLKALIAIKPFGSKIVLVAEAFGILALIVGGLLAVLVVGIIMPFAAIAVVLTAVIAGILWVVDGFMALGKSIEAAGGPMAWLTGKFAEAVAYIKAIDLGAIGTAMIEGLVAGIAGAAGKILEAMTGAVGGAIDGAKKLLGIASPSKVFAEIGMQTAAGMAGGVDSGAANVQGSLEALVAPPDAQAGGAAGGGSGKAGGAGFNFAGATFTFHGVEGAEDAEARFGVLLTRLLEGDAAQLGGEVPA